MKALFRRHRNDTSRRMFFSKKMLNVTKTPTKEFLQGSLNLGGTFPCCPQCPLNQPAKFPRKRPFLAVFIAKNICRLNFFAETQNIPSLACSQCPCKFHCHTPFLSTLLSPKYPKIAKNDDHQQKWPKIASEKYS